jgi:uncharacterized membrane protein YczE
MGLLVRAQLGVIPWDVLHQGLSRQLGVSMGTVVILVSLLLLIAWIPLRERPGLGTVSNALLVGLTLDATLLVLPPTHAIPLRVLLMIGGVVLNAVATASYIGVHLGPGPVSCGVPGSPCGWCVPRSRRLWCWPAGSSAGPWASEP